jgi:hypothetical protein
MCLIMDKDERARERDGNKSGVGWDGCHPHSSSAYNFASPLRDTVNNATKWHSHWKKFPLPGYKNRINLQKWLNKQKRRERSEEKNSSVVLLLLFILFIELFRWKRGKKMEGNYYCCEMLFFVYKQENTVEIMKIVCREKRGWF